MLLDDWMEAYLAEQERKGERTETVTNKSAGYFPLQEKGEDERDWQGLVSRFHRLDSAHLQDPVGQAAFTQECSGLRGLFLHRTQRRRPCRGYPGEPDNDTCSHRTYQGAGTKREYLTIDEIKVLIDTECPREDVKRAYLFACYCGLRLSDVYALRWKDIVQDGEQYRMSTVMQKTTTPIYLPLPAMPSVGCLKGTVRKTAACLCRTPGRTQYQQGTGQMDGNGRNQ